MISKVPFDKVMGRIENANNYNRLNIKLPLVHAEMVLKYNCGLFVAFKSKSKKLTIRYTVYSRPSTFDLSQKLKNEAVLLGKLNGEWEVMNDVQPLGDQNDIPKDGKGHDRNFELKFNIVDNYEEYQLCFPALGRVQKIEIESDDKIEYIFKPLKLIFLGSSIAQVSNDTSQGNLCCYLYRHYGINTATVAISGHNTIQFKEMVDKLKKFKPEQLIFMDNVRTTVEQYEYAYKQLRFRPIVVNTKRASYGELKRAHPEITEAHISGDARVDISHFSDLGTKEYADILKQHKII